MKKIKQVILVALLFVPLLLLPFTWFQSIISDSQTFTLKNMNGLDVFLFEHGRLGLFFALCVVLQIYCCYYERYFLAVLMQIFFGILLVLFPFSIWSFQYIQFDFLKFYGVGFYVCILCIIVNLVLNVKKIIKQK